MILIRRLFHTAEQATRGDVLCDRWLQVLWSKGVVGLRLGPWTAGDTDGDPTQHDALELYGEHRLQDSELEVLVLLAAIQHRALIRTERLAKLCRTYSRTPTATLQTDLDRLVSTLERMQPPVQSERFDDQVADILRRAMKKTNGRVYGESGAAQLLGLKPTTLQSKLKKYGIK